MEYGRAQMEVAVMNKSRHWGHAKISLETQSETKRRKELKEIDKQEDKFNKLVDKLRRNASQENDKTSGK
jgi:predicted RNA-binding protein with RPS1 domain